MHKVIYKQGNIFVYNDARKCIYFYKWRIPLWFPGGENISQPRLHAADVMRYFSMEKFHLESKRYKL